MSRDKTIPVVVGAQAISIWRDGSLVVGRLEDVIETPLTLHSSPLDLGETSGRRVRVAISDRWLQWFLLPWSDSLVNPATSRALMQMHCSAVHGEQGQPRLFAADAAPFGAPRCVAAIPEVLASNVDRWADAYGLTVDSLQPLSMLVVECIRERIVDPAYGLCIVDNGYLSLVFVVEGRVYAVLGEHCREAWPAIARRLWRRAQIRDPALATITKLWSMHVDPEAAGIAQEVDIEPVHVPIDGVLPFPFTFIQRSKRPLFNLVRRPPPIAGWRALLLGVGLAASLIAAAMLWLTSAELNHARDKVAVLTERISPVQTNVLAGREGAARAIAVNDAIRLLNVPMVDLLRSVQPPTEIRTALLGLEVSQSQVSATESHLKVMAEARSLADMADYVAYLASRSPFTSAFLVRHETVDLVGERRYRFAVEATWGE